MDPRRALVRRMVRLLDSRFGGESWDLTRIRPAPLDDLIRTILSQNTTDENRDRAFRDLRSALPAWDSVMSARADRIKRLIRPAGLVNAKGPAIQNLLKWLHRERGDLDLGYLREMTPDDGIEELIQHKGVGLKTAYIVLSFACDHDLCAVDTHVHRILQRTQVIDERCSRDKAHDELRPLIPRGKARSFHANLIDLGKQICKARSPTCPDCPLKKACAYYAETL
jgi:endonuclease III